MKPKLTLSIVQKLDKPRMIGSLTTRSNKPRRRLEARTYSNFGRTETHRVTVVELKPEDRGTLQAIAKRYRVKSLTRFLEGCLADEDAKKRKSLVPDLRGQKSDERTNFLPNQTGAGTDPQ